MTISIQSNKEAIVLIKDSTAMSFLQKNPIDKTKAEDILTENLSSAKKCVVIMPKLSSIFYGFAILDGTQDVAPNGSEGPYFCLSKPKVAALVAACQDKNVIEKLGISKFFNSDNSPISKEEFQKISQEQKSKHNMFKYLHDAIEKEQQEVNDDKQHPKFEEVKEKALKFNKMHSEYQENKVSDKENKVSDKEFKKFNDALENFHLD